MGTLTEDVLSLAVDPNSLQDGERVMVVTKTGNPVSTGIVQAVYSYGAVQLREIIDPRSAVGNRIYDTHLYSFVLMKDDVNVIDPDEFQFDRNAQSVAEDEKEDPAVDDSIKVDDKGEKVKPEGKPEAKPKKPEVDPNVLKDSQVERVMAAVSEAAMASMRSSGVSHSEIYSKVVEIQTAIKPVLEKSGA